MARPFDFDGSIMKQARLRQFGLCAVCGDCMNDVYEHAHHVVPNQAGDSANPSHSWLKSQINCVILCEDCHYAVHDSGRYRTGAVAPPEYYKHSHGGHTVEHTRWVDELNNFSQMLWGLPPKTGAKR